MKYSKKWFSFAKACAKGFRGFLKFVEELLQGAKNGAKAEDFAEDAKDIEEVVLQGKKKGKHSSSNIEGEGLYGGKNLSKAEIEDWAIILKKKFGTKLQKIENFDDPTVLAAFNPNTNTIKYKENVTEYFMTHESFHAEEMHLIGFDKYVENAHVEGTLWTIENRIHQYKREKYVYERLVENKERYKFNNEEVGIPPYGHAFQYYDYIKYKLEILLKKNNIPFPN